MCLSKMLLKMSRNREPTTSHISLFQYIAKVLPSVKIQPNMAKLKAFGQGRKGGKFAASPQKSDSALELGLPMTVIIKHAQLQD